MILDICYPEFEDKPPEHPHYTSLDETPYQVIETEEQLASLIRLLNQESVISFDIREHTYRSYLGFICVVIVFVCPVVHP